MRKAVLAAALLALSGRAPAQDVDQPSFDCKQAREPVERAICDGGTLPLLDRAMAGLYRAVRERRPELEGEQRQWLAQRNAQCGRAKPDQECLAKLYKRRIAVLTEKARDAGLLRGGGAATGDYAYRQKGEAGSMFLAEMPDGSVYVLVDTVNVGHRSPHSCSLAHLVRERRGSTLIVADKSSSATCMIEIALAGRRATMSEAPKDCFELARYWCGAHGYMLGTYEKR